MIKLQYSPHDMTRKPKQAINEIPKHDYLIYQRDKN